MSAVWWVAHGGRKMSTTVSSGRSAPEDRVSRDFNRERLDELWVADSTYIRVQEGFGYLAVVMDACSSAHHRSQFQPQS